MMSLGIKIPGLWDLKERKIRMIELYYRITITFDDGDVMELICPKALGDTIKDDVKAEFDFVKKVEVTKVFDMRHLDE